MKRAEDMLIVARSITKLYEQYVDEIRKEKQLSYIEIAILIFLSNNPSQDTAKDIARTHMLQKGNVSQGVESLIKKNYLKRIPDQNDRRLIHLSLTNYSSSLIEEIEERRTRLMNTIFKGFTNDELVLFTDLNKRIHINTQTALEGE